MPTPVKLPVQFELSIVTDFVNLDARAAGRRYQTGVQLDPEMENEPVNDDETIESVLSFAGDPVFAYASWSWAPGPRRYIPEGLLDYLKRQTLDELETHISGKRPKNPRCPENPALWAVDFFPRVR